MASQTNFGVRAGLFSSESPKWLKPRFGSFGLFTFIQSRPPRGTVSLLFPSLEVKLAIVDSIPLIFFFASPYD